MFRCKKMKKFYPVLALGFVLCMCAGSNSDYSNWYDEPEEDMLASMLGDQSTQDGSQSDDTTQPNENYDQEEVTSSESYVAARSVQPENSYASLESVDGAMSTQAVRESTVNGYVPEFRTEIVREAKIPSQNKIELTVSNKVRIKTLQDSQWRAFNNALVNVEDNQNLLITYASQQTDDYGVFRVVLEPADPFQYFSFVSLEEIGFTPYSYSMPVEALDLNTITFNMQNDEGVWHTFRYSFQTYDVRPAIDSFVKMEINSKSRPVTIRVFGAESRYPVQDAKITVRGTPPSRIRLLSKYFKDLDLLKYALSVSPDYAISTSTIYTNLAGAQFNLYCPFEYTIEVSHPDYFFASKQLQVTPATESFDIYLDRLYTNARIVQNSTL